MHSIKQSFRKIRHKQMLPGKTFTFELKFVQQHLTVHQTTAEELFFSQREAGKVKRRINSTQTKGMKRNRHKKEF